VREVQKPVASSIGSLCTASRHFRPAALLLTPDGDLLVEAAFGLAVADFHEALAAYRAEAAPYELHPVRGVLLDADGHPAAGAWIGAVGGERRWEDSTRTTAAGAFELESRDGAYNLAVDLWSTGCDVPGGDRLHYRRDIVVDGAGVGVIAFRLPEGSSCAPS